MILTNHTTVLILVALRLSESLIMVLILKAELELSRVFSNQTKLKSKIQGDYKKNNKILVSHVSPMKQ